MSRLSGVASVVVVSFLWLLPAGATEANQALREAARLGDLAAVETALDAGAEIDSGDRYDSTALFLAVRAGHLDVVRFLAEKGADVNAAESFYDSRPLGTALENGHLAIAKLLLAHGAESREGALQAAVRSDDVELARAVVEAGPLNASSLERLRTQASGGEMKELLARARSRPDPPIPTLTAEVLDRFVGRFEGWTSDNFAEARRRGTKLELIVNDGEALDLEVVEHGLVGMEETLFRSVDGAFEASFWGRYGSVEGIYLTPGGQPTEMLRRSVAEPVAAVDRKRPESDTSTQRQTVHWPGFRGVGGDGIGDGVDTPVVWDIETGSHVKFKRELPTRQLEPGGVG